MIEPEPVPDPGALEALVAARLDTVRRATAEGGGAAVLLDRRRDVTWLTRGAELHVVQGGDAVAAPVLVTVDDAVILAPNNEAARIADEELRGTGLRIETTPWYEPGAADAVARRLAGGGAVLAGAALEEALAGPRQRLDSFEHARMRWLAGVARAAMDGATATILPGRTEADVVAAMTAPLVGAGLRVPVALAGADDRMRYRHPLPTRTPIQDRLMLVLVAERWGLHVAATRMAWLSGEGRTHPADERAAAVLEAMTRATRVGATLGDVLQAAADAYQAAGLPDEWRNHHQGGTIGYGPRERVATPGDGFVLEPGMALAWNPSVPGGKAEATLLLHEDGPETILA
ncbi:MAG TPA: M24 family metallopeptidase [Candidatus Limnocylindrales bacterium]|nr:M24 family metallopeptidase [Candidatus Limnocylindrales bacterium]